jgi:hypothetical protein
MLELYFKLNSFNYDGYCIRMFLITGPLGLIDRPINKTPDNHIAFTND